MDIPDQQSAFSWLNFFGILFGLVGVAGTIYTILSWRAGKKRERVYEYLFEVAEKSIDAKATEEQLAKGKAEFEEISKRIEELQNKIREDIPKEARRTVLRDRLNTQIIHLKDIYESIKRIQSELADIGDSTELPLEIRKEIEAEIQPEFILRDKRSNLKTYLTIVTTLAAILSALLPYPANRISSLLLLIVAIPILILLARYSVPKRRRNRRQEKLDST